MSNERFLVTGALGCIGAWTVKRLVDQGTDVWTYDLGSSDHRLKLIMEDEALAKVHLVSGDITDFDAFDRVVAENGITNIVHLAVSSAVRSGRASTRGEGQPRGYVGGAEVGEAA